MRYLVDTNALIWYASDSPRLSPHADSAISDAQNEIAVSIVSFWEIAIKTSIGKLTFPQTLPDLEREILKQNIQVLPISVSALDRSASLPWHHKDPFDRVVAATALDGGWTVLSADTILDQYGVRREW